MIFNAFFARRRIRLLSTLVVIITYALLCLRIYMNAILQGIAVTFFTTKRHFATM
uniref:Uncharacterized protein n=1 Tax=Arundo donax TaxID=35708 RepID=A0A0A9F6I1_ARUDO